MLQKKAVSFLFLVLFSFSCWSAPGAKPALYQAAKGDLTVFILGSIHVGKGDYFPLDPIIEQTLSSVDELYLEVNPAQLQPENMMPTLRQYAQLPAPIPLKNRISQPIYQQLNSTLQHYKLQPEQFAYMRDWYIVMQLSMAKIQEIGMQPKFGIDQYMAQQAVKLNIPVDGLETVAEQFAAISLMDDLGSEVIYENMLTELSMAEQWLSEIENAWRLGLSDKLHALYDEYDQRQHAAELMQALLDQRNENWQQKIIHWPANKRYMLVVGDMHVHGNHNILELLKQAGFTITRVNPIG